MNVNFYLKDSKKERTAIFAVVRFKGRRYKLTPGAVVETKYWNIDGNQRASEKKPYTAEGQIINIILDRFESRVKAIFEPYILNGTAPGADEVNRLLKTDPQAPVEASKPAQLFFTDHFKTYYENAAYKLQTWKKYNTTYNYLLKYEKQFNTRLTFNAINLSFYENFRHWILTKKYRPRSGADLQNYTVNYFGSLVKCIKHVMNETGPTGARLHNNQEYRNKKFKTTHETDCQQTFLEPVYRSIVKFSENPAAVLYSVYYCKYSISNPLLNGAKQTITKTYFIAPDENSIIGTVQP